MLDSATMIQLSAALSDCASQARHLAVRAEVSLEAYPIVSARLKQIAFELDVGVEAARHEAP